MASQSEIIPTRKQNTPPDTSQSHFGIIEGKSSLHSPPFPFTGEGVEDIKSTNPQESPLLFFYVVCKNKRSCPAAHALTTALPT